MDQIEFFVTIPSNDKSLPEDQQKPNSFGVRLPQPINLDTQYQVALYEIFYENNSVKYEPIHDEDLNVYNMYVVKGTNSGSDTQIKTDMFIYCNIIEQQVVGSQYLGLLKHVSNSRLEEPQVFRSADPIQWVNVTPRHITNLTFSINDEQGNPCNLIGTTTIVLCFRKRIDL